MKRFVSMSLVAVAMFIGSLAASAQNNSLAPAPQEPVTISPKMKLADVKAVSQFIQGVEIRGTEVEAYLDTRAMLKKAADDAEKAGKEADAMVTCEMRLDQAQNLFTLMQRGTLKGVEAEKWKEIVESLRNAVKAAQEGK